MTKVARVLEQEQGLGATLARGIRTSQFWGTLLPNSAPGGPGFPTPKGAQLGLGLGPAGPAHPLARGRLPASWASGEPLGPSALGTRSGDSFPASKCGLWLRRKTPPRPCRESPLPSSCLSSRGSLPGAHFIERRTRKCGGTTHLNWLLAPLFPRWGRTAPGAETNEILGLSGPALAVRIRCGYSAAAGPGGSRRPREGPRLTPWAGPAGTADGDAGTPSSPLPPASLPDVARLLRGVWAGLGACLAASTEQLIV